MPISNRARRPDRPEMIPARSTSRMNQVWPAAIVLAAAIVFIVYLVQAGLLMALVMMLATVVAGGILVTLVAGTAWITQLRRLAPQMRGRH